MKAETPATSDVEATLDQAAEEYISLLIGLVNALPKPKKGADGKDAGKVDEVEELASEMESEGVFVSQFPLHADFNAASLQLRLLRIQLCSDKITDMHVRCSSRATCR